MAKARKLMEPMAARKKQIQQETEQVLLTDNIGLTPRPTGVMGPNGVTTWAPVAPALEPKPNSIKTIEPRTKKVGTSALGVSGTPITGGFLQDLGEYNPDLMGRMAVQTYEKMRRGDAQVWATLRAAKQPQLSATWEVIPGIAANDPGYDKAEEVADFVRENIFGGLETETSLGSIDSQSFYSVLENALLMLDFGCAIHEDLYKLDGDKIRLRAMAPRLPITFYQWITEDDGETLIGVVQYGYRGNQFMNVRVPANKICRFTYNQEGANFWGIAMQRPMYPHWYVCNSLYRVDALAGERNGMGVPCITLNEDASADDRAIAYQLVTNLAAHELTGIVLASGQTFELKGVSGAVRNILASIEHHKRQMSFSALQHFLAGGSAPFGSRSTADTQHGFFISASKYLAEQVSQCITTTTIRRLVRYNFGPEAIVPKLTVKNIKSEDFGNVVGTLVQLASAGLAVSDKPLRDHIRTQLDLPEETGEGVMAPAAPAEPGAGGEPPTGEDNEDEIDSESPEIDGDGGDGEKEIVTDPSGDKARVPGKKVNASLNLGGSSKKFVFLSNKTKNAVPKVFYRAATLDDPTAMVGKIICTKSIDDVTPNRKDIEAMELSAVGIVIDARDRKQVTQNNGKYALIPGTKLRFTRHSYNKEEDRHWLAASVLE